MRTIASGDSSPSRSALSIWGINLPDRRSSSSEWAAPAGRSADVGKTLLDRGRCHGDGVSSSEYFRDATSRPAVPTRALSLQQSRAHHCLSLWSRGAGVMIMLLAVTLYAAAGIVIAAAFLAFGVTRVLPAPVAVTLGARIMLFPGAVALWPYVLIRWLRSSR